MTATRTTAAEAATATAATAAEATTATAATRTAGTAIFTGSLGFSFRNSQGATLKFLTMKLRDCSLSRRIVSHFDKAETFAATCGFINNDFCRFNCTCSFEMLSKRVISH